MLEAVNALLSDAAAETPLVVVLDDLQWADLPSLELLTYAARELGDRPVLLAGTVRELEVGRNDAVVEALATLSRVPSTRRVTLRGLSHLQTAELVRAAAGATSSPDVVAAIQDRAEGNPFFATELAHLVEAERDPDRSLGAVSAGGDVPSSVRDVVRRRTALLPEPTVRLLQVAAVVGRESDLDLLVRPPTGTSTPCSTTSTPRSSTASSPWSTDRRARSASPTRSSARWSSTTCRRCVGPASTCGSPTPSRPPPATATTPPRSWPSTSGPRPSAWGGGRPPRSSGPPRWRCAATPSSRPRACSTGRCGCAGRPAPTTTSRPSCWRPAGCCRSSGLLHGYASVADSPHLRRAQDLARRTGRPEILARLLWTEWAAYDSMCDYARSEPIALRLHAWPTRPTTRWCG